MRISGVNDKKSQKIKMLSNANTSQIASSASAAAQPQLLPPRLPGFAMSSAGLWIVLQVAHESVRNQVKGNVYLEHVKIRIVHEQT